MSESPSENLLGSIHNVYAIGSVLLIDNKVIYVLTEVSDPLHSTCLHLAQRNASLDWY